MSTVHAFTSQARVRVSALAMHLLKLGHRACANDPPVRTRGREHIISESKGKPEFAPVGECVIRLST